jgi:hypothetical protein
MSQHRSEHILGRWLRAIGGACLFGVGLAAAGFAWVVATLNFPVPGPEPVAPFRPDYGLVAFAGILYVPLWLGGAYLFVSSVRWRSAAA